MEPGDPDGMPSPNAELLAEGDDAGGVAWPWELYRDGGRTVVVWGDRARLSVDPAEARAVAWIVDPPAQTADGRSSVVFFAVTSLLRRSGLFTVHAAAVERDGQVALLLAPSGGGKTTAMLSLVQSGWGLVSDDHPILRETSRGIEVLPFAVPPRVTAATAARFPALGGAFPPEPSRKAEVPVGRVGARGVPAALVFVEIVDRPVSRIEPLPRRRALEEVLRLTFGLASADPREAARYFGLLGRLVRETPCRRLLSGARVDQDLPDVLDAQLLEVAA